MPKRQSSSSYSSKSFKSTLHNAVFQAAHALEYGLQVTQRDPAILKIVGVRCNFCAFFGHDVLDGQERYHKQTQNVKNWTLFRPEYYRHHHNEHSTYRRTYVQSHYQIINNHLLRVAKET